MNATIHHDGVHYKEYNIVTMILLDKSIVQTIMVFNYIFIQAN